MDYYLDIRLLPDADFASPVLMNALYAKLHRMLTSDIGISFPGYDMAPRREDGKTLPPTLGLTLRLHGKVAALDHLMARRWLSGFTDHAMVGNIQPVPTHTSYVAVRRRQVKSNPARERDRLMRRKSVTLEEAMQLIPDSTAKRLTLPFLTVDSTSTGQRFLLFIDQQPAAGQVVGGFNAYGLSHDATLPAW